MINRVLLSLDLILYHSQCALRAEFSRYYLHFIWWILEPAFFLGILYLVFGVFLSSGRPYYPLFLLAGLVTWQWFGNTVNHARTSIYSSMRMFQQFRVHPIHFPLCIFVQDFAKYLPVFLIFLTVMAVFSPIGVTSVWWSIIPVMLVEALCILGTAILVASLVPFLPDLAVVVPIGVQALFFASGIFFDIEQVVLPEHRTILYTNPNAVCITAMRDILIYGKQPDWQLLAYAALIGLTILAVGLGFLTRFRTIYPRIINQ